MASLKIAVVSDVHASDGTASDDTHVLSEPPDARPRLQPLADLVSFVRSSESSIEADYLIVPGDLTNQASSGGLAYAWRRLNELATELNARLLAVPGNHDVITHVDSRDPREWLRNLLPGFPTSTPGDDDHFWANGWVLLEHLEHRVLLLDSTVTFPAFPSGVDTSSPDWDAYLAEIDRGGFPEVIEDALEERLGQMSQKLNIAVLHHHPQEHQLRSYLQDSYGAMHRGGDLIQLLSQHPNAGRWIVIHGHKHIPLLAHATGATANGPLVMCSASLGGKIWDPINTITRNQFHILTAVNDPLPGLPSIRGTVESYTWGYGQGWAVSERDGAGLPATAGFGCSDDFRTIADRIQLLMDDSGLEFMPFGDLVDELPQLPFVLPRDFEFLEAELESRGYEFQRTRRNRIAQIVRSGVSA